MTEYNIIGDIAGNYETLILLLAKMPPTATPLSVGDMVDRGPKSKQVLEFFKANGLAILGNHEHMMLDSVFRTRYYDRGVWFDNGGHATVESFYPSGNTGLPKMLTEHKDLMDWVSNLPRYLIFDGALISHAPVCSSRFYPEDGEITQQMIHQVLQEVSTLGAICDHYTDDTIIWNRQEPLRLPDLYQITGHNSHWGLQRFSDESGEFGICIDTSRTKVLTGIHWPSRVIYQQECVD